MVTDHEGFASRYVGDEAPDIMGMPAYKEPMCGETGRPFTGCICTRPRGHEGYCYAGVGRGHAIARWLRIKEGEW